MFQAVVDPHTISHRAPPVIFPPSPASIDKSHKSSMSFDDYPRHAGPISPLSGNPSSEATAADDGFLAAIVAVSQRPFMLGNPEALMHAKIGQTTPPEDAWKMDWTLDFDTADLPAPLHTVQQTERSDSGESSKSARPAKGVRVDKKDKYREKNRVAAAKCRAKKKEHTDGLEDRHRTQSMLNALLKQTEQNLRDELSFWRTQALQHGFCDCQAIQEYNLQKARALAAHKDFGDMDGLRRDSMACTSPTSHLGHAMYPGAHGLEPQPS